MMPDEKSSGIIQSTINRLSKRFNTSPFEPHITGCRVDVTECTPKDAEQILEHIAEQHSPFQLQSDHLKSTDHPFRKLFLTFRNHSIASPLLNDLNHYFNGHKKASDLHLSILYSTVSISKVWNSIKESEIDLPEMISITSLALVRLSDKPTDWKLLSIKKISG